jgi:hypothetical protein
VSPVELDDTVEFEPASIVLPPSVVNVNSIESSPTPVVTVAEAVLKMKEEH